MVNKYLEPVFNSLEISNELIFINCSLGYNGSINLLFADKQYDIFNVKQRKITDPLGKRDFGYRTVKEFKIQPSLPQNYRLTILGENYKVIEFNNEKINYTHGMQIDSDTYCFICHTTDKKFKNNVKLTDCKGKTINEFTIGTGVNGVQTNSKHELWVSYSDFGIYSNIFEKSVEESGLNCFDVFGELIYAYSNRIIIDECNSLNILSENEIIINIYSGSLKSWYAFGKIIDKAVSKIIEWNEYTRFLACSGNKILVERNQTGEIKSKFALLDIGERVTEIEQFEFFNKKNKKLNCIYAQGDKLYFWGENELYKISIEDCIRSRVLLHKTEKHGKNKA
jgi:hypothetical protein